MRFSLQTKDIVDGLMRRVDDHGEDIRDVLMSIVQEHHEQLQTVEGKRADYENAAKVYKEAMEEALEDKRAYRTIIQRGDY